MQCVHPCWWETWYYRNDNYYYYCIILLSAHPPLNYQLLKHNLIVVHLIRIIILSLLVHTNLTTAVSIPFSPDPAKPARTAWPARDNAWAAAMRKSSFWHGWLNSSRRPLQSQTADDKLQVTMKNSWCNCNGRHEVREMCFICYS